MDDGNSETFGAVDAHHDYDEKLSVAGSSHDKHFVAAGSLHDEDQVAAALIVLLWENQPELTFHYFYANEY